MEAPIDYEGPERMAGDVERKILGKQTPYSNFPAMPKMDRDFVELVSSKRFKDSVEKVRMAMGDTRTIQGGNALMQLDDDRWSSNAKTCNDPISKQRRIRRFGR